MKKITASLCAIVSFGCTAYAGSNTFSGKETSPEVPQTIAADYFRDRELNLNLFGTYALTGTEYREDRYLGTDHAFGAGIDAKYFLARYFGFGVEGFVFDANDVTRGDSVTGFTGIDDHERRAIGGALGTFTFRLPIRNSRFAPYVYLGGGTIFGGGRTTETIVDVNSGSSFRQDVRAANVEALGQIGIGFEMRLTSRLGLTSDFNWNLVNGAKNNFGMVRTGLNFAF